MIRLLEKHVADKIAAGEVVDRPVSVVKELVENSIDAGSTSITVEISHGGKDYIRVSDNGCGIPKDEVIIAFKRHATSKITEVKDLDSIYTLGFRGEALASISAVSRTTLITRTHDTEVGTKVEIDGSQTADVTSFGCDAGTSVIVKDLFYNTPARLKFMKSDSTEANIIIEFVSQIALCYPNIRIKMINNGTILFSTPGKGSRLNAIATIYGRTVSDCLVPVSYTVDDYHINGFVSNVGESRNSKKHQIFFVNGRVISSRILTDAVKEAYRERMFAGRFPIAFLFLEVPADTLDINIHPNKREVRFNNDRKVEELTIDAIKIALSTNLAAPEIEKKKAPEFKISKEKIFHEKKPQSQREVIVNEKPEHSQEQINVKEILSTLRKNEQKVHEEPAPVIRKALRPFEFNELRIIGTVFGTYIITQDESYMYLIDQHAAHERIFYEKLMNQFKMQESLTQSIFTPILIDVPINSSDLSYLDNLMKMGFILEEFGGRTYKVSGIPSFMTISEAEIFLKDYLYSTSNENSLLTNTVLDDIAMRACKAAVKGNNTLSDSEIRVLLDDLSKCDNPYSCPHGRPTYIKMSKMQLERSFKRV